MASTDYILRLIEQFGRAMIALRKRILGREGSDEQRGEELRELTKRAGIDLDFVRFADMETILLLVAPGGEVEPARCWMSAEALYLHGLESELQGDGAQARTSFTKARILYSLIAPMGAMLVGLTEARERIQEIDARLGALGSEPSERPREAGASE